MPVKCVTYWQHNCQIDWNGLIFSWLFQLLIQNSSKTKEQLLLLTLNQITACKTTQRLTTNLLSHRHTLFNWKFSDWSYFNSQQAFHSPKPIESNRHHSRSLQGFRNFTGNSCPHIRTRESIQHSQMNQIICKKRNLLRQIKCSGCVVGTQSHHHEECIVQLTRHRQICSTKKKPKGKINVKEASVSLFCWFQAWHFDEKVYNTFVYPYYLDFINVFSCVLDWFFTRKTSFIFWIPCAVASTPIFLEPARHLFLSIRKWRYVLWTI